jgi:hypothetical protein
MVAEMLCLRGKRTGRAEGGKKDVEQAQTTKVLEVASPSKTRGGYVREPKSLCLWCHCCSR